MKSYGEGRKGRRPKRLKLFPKYTNEEQETTKVRAVRQSLMTKLGKEEER